MRSKVIDYFHCAPCAGGDPEDRDPNTKTSSMNTHPLSSQTEEDEEEEEEDVDDGLGTDLDAVERTERRASIKEGFAEQLEKIKENENRLSQSGGFARKAHDKAE